jgi:hypothetical protein
MVIAAKGVADLLEAAIVQHRKMGKADDSKIAYFWSLGMVDSATNRSIGLVYGNPQNHQPRSPVL